MLKNYTKKISVSELENDFAKKIDKQVPLRTKVIQGKQKPFIKNISNNPEILKLYKN